jgi:hypothetical protein
MHLSRISLIAAISLILSVCLGPGAIGQSAAPVDPMGASYWTGTYTFIDSDSIEWQPGPGYSEALGVTERASVEATDPRISGAWVQVRNLRSYASREPDQNDVAVSSSTARIDNDDGAWVGTFNGYYGGPGGEEWNVFVGEGAYGGLTAVFRYHGDNTLEGVILPGDLPAGPDPVASPAN